jgi:hypothetical protein
MIMTKRELLGTIKTLEVVGVDNAVERGDDKQTHGFPDFFRQVVFAPARDGGNFPWGYGFAEGG